MHLHENQTVHLRDRSQRLLGHVIVERCTDNLITGSFQSGPEYSAVAGLFQRFEEAANNQALAVVDEIDAAIAALGLSLSLPDGSERLAIHDVQIWSDGGFSCRLGCTADPNRNGAQAAQTSRQAAP